jgi:hypothetical protein
VAASMTAFFYNARRTVRGQGVIADGRGDSSLSQQN